MLILVVVVLVATRSKQSASPPTSTFQSNTPTTDRNAPPQTTIGTPGAGSTNDPARARIRRHPAPLLLDDVALRLLLTDDGADVVAVDLDTRAQRWTTTLEGECTGTAHWPDHAQELLSTKVVVLCDETVFTLDPKTGQQQSVDACRAFDVIETPLCQSPTGLRQVGGWELTVERNENIGGLGAAGARVYLVTSTTLGTSTLVAVDRATGARVWEHAGPIDYVGADDARAYATVGRQLIALGSPSGEAAWTFDLPFDAPTFIASTARQVLLGDPLTGTVVSLDPSTGARRWTARADGVHEPTFVATSSRVLVTGHDAASGLPDDLRIFGSDGGEVAHDRQDWSSEITANDEWLAYVVDDPSTGPNELVVRPLL